MKLTKKLLAILLLVCMVLPLLVACGEDPVDPVDPVDPEDPIKTPEEIYNEECAAIYDEIFGEFYAIYTQAKKCTSVSERHALMAVAEAKLLAAGVMLPSSSQGGNYAISRAVPYSATSVLWGNDSDRFYTMLIADGDPLTPAIRDEMKAYWSEHHGDGTYLEWAEDYLADKGISLNRHYTFGYTSDPQTWDALATSEAADSEAIVNTYDGLLEYDCENVLRPALAEALPTVSADGLTYTFKIRQGVKWVDNQGREIGELKAQDFVNGMRHALDAAGGLEYLVQGVIVNADEYLRGEITDFSKVGVKAIDEYTVAYTICEPSSYFTTMFGYNIFAPICTAAFLQYGGAFGVAEFAEAKKATTYTYGTTHEYIGYCGPYVVTAATSENSIEFAKNESYWNVDAVNLDQISWKFIDGQDPTESFDLMTAGTFAGAGLGTQALQKAKTELVPGTDKSWFETYAYVSGVDATSYPMFLNLNRKAYANHNDATVAVSTMTDADKVRTNAAMLNQNFRLAIVTGLDRAAYNATTQGDDLKLNNLVNSYTPGNFVSLTENVTIMINGKATTFTKGTFYGEIMQAQLDADKVPVTVWDPAADGGAGGSFGFDGWYDVTNSRAYLTKAVAELAAEGITVDAQNPIQLDLPYFDVSPVYTNRATSLKQSIEASSQGLIVVNLVKCGGSNANNWYHATYFPETGDTMNYNLADNSGWGPDYGDPQTYLDTMLPEGAGYMVKCFGLW